MIARMAPNRDAQRVILLGIHPFSIVCQREHWWFVISVAAVIVTQPDQSIRDQYSTTVIPNSDKRSRRTIFHSNYLSTKVAMYNSFHFQAFSLIWSLSYPSILPKLKICPSLLDARLTIEHQNHRTPTAAMLAMSNKIEQIRSM